MSLFRTSNVAVALIFALVSLPATAQSVDEDSIKIAFESLGYEERRQVQVVLSDANHYNSGIDAEYGPGTQEAILMLAEELRAREASNIALNSPENAAAALRYMLGNDLALASGEAKEQSDVIPSVLTAFAENLDSQIVEVMAFEGDFDGDADSDLLGIIYSAVGNSIDANFLLFENVAEDLQFIGYADDAFGLAPSNVTFLDGGIRYNTPALRQDDQRCCPTGISLQIIDLADVRTGAKLLDDLQEEDKAFLGTWSCATGNMTISRDGYALGSDEPKAFTRLDAGVNAMTGGRYARFEVMGGEAVNLVDIQDHSLNRENPYTGRTFQCTR